MLRFHSSSQRNVQRGQSTIELAIVLPVLLMLLLLAIDFGRAFYSAVTLTNAARVAANYAAMHPTASFGPGSDYAQMVANDAANASCPLQSVPTPQFPDTAAGTTPALGSRASVTMACSMPLFTPLVSSIVGNPSLPGRPLSVASSAIFLVRVGTVP